MPLLNRHDVFSARPRRGIMLPAAQAREQWQKGAAGAPAVGRLVRPPQR